MPISNRHRAASPWRRATVAAKKSGIIAPLRDARFVLFGTQPQWWDRAGGGGAEAYDSTDNKRALCAAPSDIHSCSSPSPASTKAQENECKSDKIFVIRSLLAKSEAVP